MTDKSVTKYYEIKWMVPEDAADNVAHLNKVLMFTTLLHKGIVSRFLIIPKLNIKGRRRNQFLFI